MRCQKWRCKNKFVYLVHLVHTGFAQNIFTWEHVHCTSVWGPTLPGIDFNMTLLLFVWLWDAKNDDAKVNLSILFTQALHKISLRESVCTVRVCEVLLSLASTLIDLGVLANNAARALLLSSLVKSDNNMASAEDGITASAVLPVTDCQVGYRVTKFWVNN